MTARYAPAARCLAKPGLQVWLVWLLALAVALALSPAVAQTSNAAPQASEPSFALTREAMLEDLEFTRAMLQRHQPNFGLHSSEDSINATFDSIAEALPETASLREFLRALLPGVAAVRDGHTCLTFAPDQLEPEMRRMRAVSLDLIALEGRLYLERERFTVPAGSELLSINDRPIADWIAAANSYFCLDKTSDITAFDASGDTLPFYFWLVDPSKTLYSYALRLPDGKIKTLRLRGSNPLRQFSRQMESQKARFAFEVRNGVPLLSINTFLGEKDAFESFFDHVFKELNSQGVKDLIIDLRENTGGQIGNASLLLAYLLDRSHHFPRYIHVMGARIKNDTPIFLRGMNARQVDDIRKSSNRLQLRYRNYPTRYDIQPRGTAVETQSVAWGKRHFRGRLHVLVSGKTYSAASLFVGELRKNRPDALFYGERTGGLDNRGCMRNPVDFQLPNSKLLLSVPIMCHIQDLSADAQHFLPDVEDSLTLKDFLEQRDTVLEDVVDMIRVNAEPEPETVNRLVAPLPLPKPAPFLAVKP